MIVLVFRTEHVQRLLAPLESLLNKGEQDLIFLLGGAEEGANMPARFPACRDPGEYIPEIP